MAGETPVGLPHRSLSRQSATACSAPDTSLSFRPDGTVLACCSAFHVLGRVAGPGRTSLGEIWEGAARQQLRSALDAGDFGLGCVDCGRSAAAGRREESLAWHFDRFANEPGPPTPRVMDFALSNRCNLECVMCSGYFSSRVRRNRERRPPLSPVYEDSFFDELTDYLPGLRRALFKGGEPFLSRENYRIWDRMIDIQSSAEISVTTNGTMWNEEVERYLIELRMEPIVSVDAVSPEVFETIRLGADGRSVWRNVDRFQQTVDQIGSTLTLSMCLMRSNWRELPRFLEVVAERDVNPNIVWVWVPNGAALLTLPEDDLKAVLVFLTAAHRRRTTHPRTEPVWQEVLRRIEDRLNTAPPTGQTGTTPIGRHQESNALVVDFDGDVAVRVESPPWADLLAPTAWVGSGLQDIPRLLADVAPGSTRLNVDDRYDGGLTGTLILEIDGETFHLLFELVPTGSPPVTGGYRLLITPDASAQAASIPQRS